MVLRKKRSVRTQEQLPKSTPVLPKGAGGKARPGGFSNVPALFARKQAELASRYEPPQFTIKQLADALLDSILEPSSPASCPHCDNLGCVLVLGPPPATYRWAKPCDHCTMGGDT